MERPLKGVILVGCVAILLAVHHLWPGKSTEEISRETKQDYEEYGRQKAIVDALRPVIDASTSLGQQPTYLRGKALVWDISSDQRSIVYAKLPGELKAHSSDSPITVFMVTTGHDVVGHYETTGQPGPPMPIGPAYQGWVSIAVAYWPEKIAVGIDKLAGPRPVEHISTSGGNSPDPNLTDPDVTRTISDYILALPRGEPVKSQPTSAR